MNTHLVVQRGPTGEEGGEKEGGGKVETCNDLARGLL
jgi:hypothetical protein